MAKVNLHVNLLGTISSTVLYTDKISNISIRYNDERENISVFIFNRKTKSPVIKLYFSVYELMLLFKSDLHDMEIIGKGKVKSVKNARDKKGVYDIIETFVIQLNKFFNNVLGKNNANYNLTFYWEDVYLNRETFIEIVGDRSNYLSLPTQKDRDREYDRQLRNQVKHLGLDVQDGQIYMPMW